VHVVNFHKYPNPMDIHVLKKWSKKRHVAFIDGLFKNDGIDIVHTYYNLNLCKPYLLKAKDPKYNFKLVIRIAGMRWYEQIAKNDLFKRAYEELFKEADSLNFISEGLLTLFKKGLKELNMKFQPKHYFVKDIGTQQLTLSAPLASNKKTREFKCIMVSRFSNYQKHQDILVKAVSLIDNEIPIHLTFIGDGPAKGKIESLARASGVIDKITFLPFLPQQEVWKTILEHDLLCHACEYEGLSKIIIESMGLGMAVLASDVIPLNNYITDGVNGFLTTNSPYAWSEKIKYLSKCRDDLHKVGNNATHYIKMNYNADLNIKEYEKQFEALLDNR